MFFDALDLLEQALLLFEGRHGLATYGFLMFAAFDLFSFDFMVGIALGPYSNRATGNMLADGFEC